MTKKRIGKKVYGVAKDANWVETYFEQEWGACPPDNECVKISTLEENYKKGDIVRDIYHDRDTTTVVYFIIE